jgi:purine-binding chemotaxis protein CheW
MNAIDQWSDGTPMSTEQTATHEPVESRRTNRRPPSELGGKYLTFFLGAEEYGIEILRVSEIIGTMAITTIPRTAAHVRGVINLRGKVIPVVDLRRKLGMPAKNDTDETCIVVVQINAAPMGLIVDKVSEVLAIDSSHIEEPPSFGASVRADYLLGLGTADGKVKLLLDVDHVLATGEADALQSAGAESAEDPEGAEVSIANG